MEVPGEPTATATVTVTAHPETSAEPAHEKAQPKPAKKTESKPPKKAETKPPKKKAAEPTVGQQNALASAESYLEYTAFSKKGLKDQLRFEEYGDADAQWAVDNVGADWMEQAVRSGEKYLDYTAFSESELRGQLEFEGFTAEQAAHGAAVAYGNG